MARVLDQRSMIAAEVRSAARDALENETYRAHARQVQAELATMPSRAKMVAIARAPDGGKATARRPLKERQIGPTPNHADRK